MENASADFIHVCCDKCARYIYSNWDEKVGNSVRMEGRRIEGRGKGQLYLPQGISCLPSSGTGSDRHCMGKKRGRVTS